MNPVWFIVRAAGIALITVASATLLMKKFAPKPSNLVAGAIHFKKALDEFQKGARTVFFGPPEPTTPETTAARKESGRIRIE